MLRDRGLKLTMVFHTPDGPMPVQHFILQRRPGGPPFGRVAYGPYASGPAGEVVPKRA